VGAGLEAVARWMAECLETWRRCLGVVACGAAPVACWTAALGGCGDAAALGYEQRARGRGGTARARAWMARLRARERGYSGGAAARRGGGARGHGEIGGGLRRRKKNTRSERMVKKGEIRFSRDDRTR
jgi:hypothetical protein